MVLVDEKGWLENENEKVDHSGNRQEFPACDEVSWPDR